MPNYLGYILIFILTAQLSSAQAPRRPVRQAPKKVVPPPPEKKEDKKTNLGVGFGATRSVIYLARNVKPNNDATGLNVSLVYGGSKLFRASLEYTRYMKLDIAPTWYNIKASTIEMNMHILARFKGKNAYFYPLFGLSYNEFSGKYTGINDFLNLSELYKPGQHVVTRWLGVNIGTGYELYFKPGSFFLDYKMRVGKTEGYNQINIQDVCISAGLRFNLRAPSVSLNKIFMYKPTRSRYRRT